MDSKYEIKYLKLECDGWWFRARRDILFRLLPKGARDMRILDVGCSGGALLSAFKGLGFNDLWGVDVSTRSVEHARRAGLENIFIADAVQTGFPSESFDIIIASDTLEHVSDEHRALTEWFRLLRPGGRLLIFVPAHQFLWSAHDIANHHVKRYDKKDFQTVILKAGFRIRRLGWWNFSFFFPAFFVRFLPSKPSGSDQLYSYGSFLNNFCYSVLRIENILLASHIQFPIGVSLFAIAEKKDYRSSHISQIKSARYEEEIYRFGSYDDYIWQEEKKILAREVHNLAKHNKKISYLDFACGGGRVLSFLEDQTAIAVGVDVSHSMLEYAHQRVKRARLIESDITTNDVLTDEAFDLITAFRFYLNAQSALRTNVFHLLKKKLRNKDAILIFNMHGNRFSTRFFTEILLRMRGRRLNTSSYVEIKRFLDANGFKLVRWYGVGVLPKIFYRMFPPDIITFLDRALSRLPGVRFFAQDLIFICHG